MHPSIALRIPKGSLARRLAHKIPQGRELVPRIPSGIGKGLGKERRVPRLRVVSLVFLGT